MQVHTSKVANQNASLTQVEDMCGLVSPIVQGLKLNVLIGFSGGSKSFSKYMYVYLSCNTAFFFLFHHHFECMK